ncbi:lichenicidin A2 family type 2 lantibiotic (plasmid) [Macrococcoides canis]|uniref:lichenicidin A2 family type 2 lantibiotic n=1 Tax=Macrococcoides canis TaxID=1855823 RepID=UPI001F27E19F|nr:lichenicidin A2 family type 2 lantibiotic [Macrococcus canis]UJS29013.1 lichenicidin A2 family type 2 lantibiotic [Macrococcus canis]
MNNIIGESFEDMSIEEMKAVQGTGDVNAETTPSLIMTSPYYQAAATVSSAGCATGVGGLIGVGAGAILSSTKRC